MNAWEAADIARRAAERANIPWSDEVTVRRMWRLWPLPRMWRVVSRTKPELAESTIFVNEKTRQAVVRQVRHAKVLG